MVLYIGDEPIAGYSTNTKMNAHSLLDFKFCDHILNELSWVNADTFSWLSGDVYTAVYNKLVAEYDTGTTETETGVSYKKSDNGFKIADASQEQAVIDSYNSTGVAWFYILDTANRRFKLPRTKYGFTGLRDGAGNYVEAGLPNITGEYRNNCGDGPNNTSGAIFVNNSRNNAWWSGATNVQRYNQINFDASLSNSIYGNSDTVQPPSTQMYLYFYVGEFAQSAIEQTAGYAQTLTEKKADVDLSNVNASGTSLASGWSMPSSRYIVLTLGASGSVYTAPANGWFRLTTNARSNTTFSQNSMFSTSGIGSSATANASEWAATSHLPVKKGEVITVLYSSTVAEYTTFIFSYAEGEQ